MPYDKNQKIFIPIIKELINVNNEVLVDWYTNNHFSNFYFIKCIKDLEDLLNRSSITDLIFIYKLKQLPIRGRLNVEFKNKVLREYGDKDYDFIIYTYNFYPRCLEMYGHGENRSELNQRLDELLSDFGDKDITLCFGIDPEPEIRDISVLENDEFILISGGN